MLNNVFLIMGYGVFFVMMTFCLKMAMTSLVEKDDI